MSAKIPIVFSTGGGGQFEAKVKASSLLHRVIGRRVACVPNGHLQSAGLQANQAGCSAYDVLVSVRTEAGAEHRILAKIKHPSAYLANSSSVLIDASV